jgi:predicted TIM-barrel fold metal-dependent hydrolase
MRIVDCHIHLNGQADAGDVLQAMDANSVDRIIVLSQSERKSLSKTRENLLVAKGLLDAAPERISVLAWVNPTIDGIADLAAEAVERMGFAGIKIIPDHWYAHEARLEPFWERMNQLGASILFHTGILYGFEDASRFCRPVYLEKLLHYPDIRFAMAHISWPWCEECLAVMGRMRAATRGPDRQWQSYVDITPGTPAHIRKQALANAIDFCGPERIMFGTDCKLPGPLSRQGDQIASDLAIFDELGLDEAGKQRIMAGTADEVFPARA